MRSGGNNSHQIYLENEIWGRQSGHTDQSTWGSAARTPGRRDFGLNFEERVDIKRIDAPEHHIIPGGASGFELNRQVF